MLSSKYLTPRQIVMELDKYIVGQNEAKRNVAIALRNRWRRMNANAEMKNEIIPNNILMIGATGSRQNRNCPQACKNRGGSVCKSRSVQIYRSRICGPRCGKYGS